MGQPILATHTTTAGDTLAQAPIPGRIRREVTLDPTLQEAVRRTHPAAEEAEFLHPAPAAPAAPAVPVRRVQVVRGAARAGGPES